MVGHARLSPSDAPRWLHCAPAVDFTEPMVDERDNEVSAEGTAAHTVREWCLELGFEPYDFIGTKIAADGFVFEVDAEMADHLQPGIDEIRQFPGELFVEKWVDATEWLGLDRDGNRQGGTLDAGIVSSKLIVLSDLKFGRGVPVEAVRNEQQMIYALAFWQQIARHVSEATDFLIIIDQPRNSAGGGYWHTTLEELLKFGEWVKIRAAATLDRSQPFTPTDKGCLWCMAATVPGRPGGCKAFVEAQLEKIESSFEDLDDAALTASNWEPPKVLTPAQEAVLCRSKATIERFLEAVHENALRRRIDYGPDQGLKAVRGKRPARKWRDPPTAQAWLSGPLSDDKIFTKKLISPAQAESALGRGAVLPTSLIEAGEPKPILVPVEDGRPSIQTVENEFDEEI